MLAAIMEDLSPRLGGANHLVKENPEISVESEMEQ